MNVDAIIEKELQKWWNWAGCFPDLITIRIGENIKELPQDKLDLIDYIIEKSPTAEIRILKRLT